MKKQKDRLVEVASQVLNDFFARKVANRIIADGWIRPPIGDKLYIITEVSKTIVETTVIGVWVYEKSFTVLTIHGNILNDSFGKTVFLSREEAEAKLKEGVQG